MDNDVSVLDDLIARAKKVGKPTSSLYVLKALVELGKGWHTFKVVLAKAIEVSGNTKMKYYPIQEISKLGLAELRFPEGALVSETQVRLPPLDKNKISRRITLYFEEFSTGTTK